MSTNLYFANAKGFIGNAANMDCGTVNGCALLEGIGINPQGPDGTVGTIKHRDLPNAIINQARIVARLDEADTGDIFSPLGANLNRNRRFLKLLIAAHDSGHDVGWS